MTIFGKSISQTFDNIKNFSFDKLWNGYTKGTLIPEIGAESATKQLNEFADHISIAGNTVEMFFNRADKDSNFEKFINSTTEAERTTENYIKFTNAAREAQILNGEVIEQVGLKAKVASAGFKALSLAGNMLLGMAVGAALQGLITIIDDFIHREERLIEAGEKAQSNISNTFNEFSQGKSTIEKLGKSFADAESDIKNMDDAIDSIAGKYDELADGVNKLTNENESLTSDQYQEYIDLSNQLAEQFPTLVSGYDAQGNAILNMGNSASDAAEKLRDLYDAQQLSANVEISDNLQSAYDGIITQIGQYEKEIAGYKDKNEELSNDIDYAIASQNQIQDGLLEFGSGIFTMSGYTDDKYRVLMDIMREKGVIDLVSAGVYGQSDVDFVSDQIKILTQADVDYINEEYRKRIGDAHGDAIASMTAERNQNSRNASSKELLIQDRWKSLSSSLGNYLQTADSFTGLDSNIQNAILSSLRDVNFDQITNEYNGEILPFIYGEFIEPIASLDKDAQEAISSLLELDMDEMTSTDYRTQWNSVLESLFPDDIASQNEWKDRLGFTDAFSDVSKETQRLIQEFGDNISDIDAMTIGDKEIAYDLITNDGFSGTFEELLAKIEETKALGAKGIDIYANPVFDSIEDADGTKNAGDDYLKAVGYLKEAKEMYDEGLVGTDDFKRRAAYLSPTGAEDPANFIENYEKATRYLTEDSTGVKNFLDDLDTKGFAEFNEETQEWTYNMDDLQAAAKEMGMGFEFFMDMFGRLEDYGFTNDFFGSTEEGIEHLTQLYGDLATAEAELHQLETEDPGNTTAIQAKKEEIEGLNRSIDNTKQNLQTLLEIGAEDADAQVSAGKAAIESMHQELAELDPKSENYDSVKAIIEEQISAIADEYHIELDAELNIVENTDGTTEESSTTEGGTIEKKVQYTAETTPEYETVEEKAKTPVKKPIEFIAKGLSAVAKYLNDGTKEQETVTVPSDVTTEAVFDDTEANKKIDAYIAKLASIIKQAPNGGTNAVVNTETAVQKINDLKTIITDLPNGDIEPAVTIENAKKIIDDLKSYIFSIPDGEANPGIDIESALLTIAELESVINSIPDGESTPNVNTADAVAILDYLIKLIEEIPNGDTTITAEDLASSTINSVSSSLESLDGKEAKTYVTTVHRSANGELVGGGGGLDFVNGNAHSHTTPMISSARFNDGYLGTAYANGTWGETHNTTALTGELGRELVVRGNRFFTVGDNGAEMVNLKKGDIVFNHLQTREILTKGYTTGRGKALAQGNARNSGFGKFVGGAADNNSASTSAVSNATTAQKSYTKAMKDTTKASDKGINSFKKFQKWADKLHDWIEVFQQRCEEIIDLNLAISENAKGYQNKNASVDTALAEIKKLIDGNIDGAARYYAQADQVTANAISGKLFAKKANGKKRTKAQQKAYAADLVEQIQNGTIDISKYGEKVRAFIDEYSEWYDKAKDTEQAIEDLKQQQKELAQQKLDNIADQYDAIISHLEHQADLVNGFMDIAEMKGYVQSTKYFDELIKNASAQKSELETERAALISSLQKSMDEGIIEKYSLEWYNMQSQINDVSKRIQDADASVIEFGNSIRDIDWSNFDRGMEYIGQLTKESDFLKELMSNDKMFSDNGDITNEGMATVGLHGVDYNTYMRQADEYFKEMKQIESDLAKDENKYNVDLIDRRNELLELQRESILAAEDEKQAIIDLVKEGIDKQLESLESLIDKYGEALDSQKDLDDYQKQISEQSGEVSRLTKLERAYSLDTTEEGRLRLQETQNALKEARESLKQTEEDRAFEDQKKLLEKLYQEYEEVLNERLENTDEVIRETIATINENAGQIGETLKQEVSDVGAELSDEMKEIWGDGGAVPDALSVYTEDFDEKATNLQDSIDGILGYVEEMSKAADEQAEDDVDSSSPGGSANPQVGKTPVEEPVQPIQPQKTEQPKAEEKKKSSGDGKIKVGEKVTFASGKYTATSAGTGASGKKKLGKEVYVTKIASSGSRKYHISTGKKLGSGDLGWVKKSQLKGYATGTSYVPKSDYYKIFEDGQELVEHNGTMLTRLGAGDKVFNATATDNLYDIANNPEKYFGGNRVNTGLLPGSVMTNTGTTNIDNITFSLPDILDPEGFMNWLVNTKKAQRALADVLIAPMNGKSALTKYRNKF